MLSTKKSVVPNLASVAVPPLWIPLVVGLALGPDPGEPGAVVAEASTTMLVVTPLITETEVVYEIGREGPVTVVLGYSPPTPGLRFPPVSGFEGSF